MDDTILSAGVRHNLLAVQSTSSFTAQSLHSRAGDFNSLLDSIGHAQQVLAAANQSVYSLSKLVQSGISTARQAQQSPIGYAIKSNLSTTIGGATALDLRGSTTYMSAQARSNGGISGTTLTFTSFNGGTPIDITFGDGTGGTIKTLDQLNAALAPNNLTATLDTSGKLTISASNDYASSTLGGAAGGQIGGTVSCALTWTVATAPVPDANALATRARLQNDYNNLLTQIDQLAKDSSFGGVNLIHGDSLNIVFNENGSSALQIVGVTFSAAGLGLASPTVNAFQDNASINLVVASLYNALVTLRTQASKFGSNLSVVQNRQDFTKNMINLLTTGADSLVLADSNEEGANMLALQTRQQLSTTALSLASQADQAVLRVFG